MGDKVAKKYKNRIIIMLISIPFWLILWRFGIFQHPYIALHEYGHNLLGGSIIPNFTIAPDGLSGIGLSYNLFGVAFTSAGGFIGTLLFATLFQFIPNGVIKGFGVAVFIQAEIHFISSSSGLWKDLAFPGAYDIAVVSQLFFIPLFLLCLIGSWILSLRKEAKKAEKEALKFAETRSRLNRLKTA